MVWKFIASFIFITNVVHSQQYKTVYFNHKEELTTSIENAASYVTLSYNKNKIKSTYYKKFNDKWEENYREEVELLNDSVYFIEKIIDKKKKRSTYRTFIKKGDSLYTVIDKREGIIVSKGNCKSVYPLIKHGVFYKYYENGQMEADEIYINNLLISNERWLINGNKALSNVFEYCDVLPEYPGGETALFTTLGNTTHYPSFAKDQNIQGTVYVSFVITEVGKLVEMQIIRGIHETLDQEALRVVDALASPWKPGTNNEIPIKLHFTLPIQFRLK